MHSRALSRRSFTALLASLAIVSQGLTQTPAQDGAWSAPFDLPLIAIHQALLPTGDVLLFSAEHGVPGIHGWLLDPGSLALTEVAPPAGWNPDCSGHSFLPDGRLVVAGGTLSFTPLTGTKKCYAFDPVARSWDALPDMAAGRWYPSCLTLADGRVVTMAGLSDTSGVQNPDIEVFRARSPSNWNLLGQKLLPYYPMLHVLPGGSVFRAGPDPSTETYDPDTDEWSPVDATLFPGRYEAPSVLLPQSSSRVMLIGGFSGAGAPTSSCEIIDLAQAIPAWRGTAHMAFPRMEHDAVILPDGNVLVVGGQSNAGEPGNPVLSPELFDPTNEAWRTLAPHQVPRMYHSTTLLLPDGRVLSAGGDFEPSAEIYSPPYLFQGPRPTISAVSGSIVYGSAFSVSLVSTTAENEVVLIRLSSVTHSTNMGQRYLHLATFSGGSGTYQVPGPFDGTVAPPGFYMLFIVDSSGVPSVARILRVGRPRLPAVRPGKLSKRGC